MNTEQNNNDTLNQARNLYFQTSLTQAQIAAIIGVSQKTVSLYINENKWKMLKERAAQAPSVFLEQMNSELQELNEVIASRPVGQRFPTMQEAGIRRRIMLSIATIKDKQSAGHHAEVLNNFISTVYFKNTKLARVLVKYADQYLKGEMKAARTSGFIRYDLPAELGIPCESADTPASEAGTSSEAVNKAA